MVYIGNFSKDRLLYSDFIGKSTAEANQMYVGKKNIYIDEEYFVVDLADVNAVYYGSQGKENLTGEIMIEGVYVLENSFQDSGEEVDTIFEVNQLLGDPIYEGNSYVIMPEAVAIHIMNRTKNEFYGEVITNQEQYLEDVVIVNEFDRNYGVYLYTYIREGIRYTFFTKDKNGTFSMYLIEKIN